MSNFGCFYNPRPAPGRCIKDNRSSVVEDKCEVVSDSCRLKPSSKKAEPAIVTPSIPKETNRIIYQEGQQKLSGPVSAYYSEMDGVKFNFFGDAHFSFANTCNTGCKSIDMKTLEPYTPDGSQDCWELSRVLAEVFNRAFETKQFVDFYIEIPYLSTSGFLPSQKELGLHYEKFGYIYKLYYIFYRCFHKLNCKYDYVRFHYVDIRLEYKAVEMPQMMKNLEDIVNPNLQSFPKFETRDNTFEMFVLLELMPAATEMLARKIQNNDVKPSRMIEFVNSLIKELYYSGGQTLAGEVEPKNYKLIKIYLTSNNFTDDMLNLMGPLLAQIDNEKVKSNVLNGLLVPRMIVNRRGKNMHRIRAQLEALEEEGKQDLANNIVLFILGKYKTKVDNSDIRQLWNKYMNIYNNLVYGTKKDMNEAYKNLAELEKSYQNFQSIMMYQVSGNALLMDAYTLARMFRTFPGTTHQKGDKNIVYAGQAHIDTYNDFLLHLNQKIIGFNPNLNNDYIHPGQFNRCLNVDMKYFL